ncbi:MAG: hypothetical protein EU539_01465 [Promethearchaeota archaeon]|nr:MAG: hypothetical protein EU539_01465 [Candidatus Lokiarchaeota archaeon]
MSKFERYKKKDEDYYVYPHKHCQKCGAMIDESVSYCADCYEKIKEKKEKKRFRWKKKKEESNQKTSSE